MPIKGLFSSIAIATVCVGAYVYTGVAAGASYHPLVRSQESPSQSSRPIRSAGSLVAADGRFLNEFPPNFDASIRTTCEFNGSLFVGGEFSVGAEGSPSCVARYDGSRWHNLENGVYSWAVPPGPGVYCMTPYQGDVYAGGAFWSIGSVAANHVSRWDGAAWQPVSGGVGGLAQPEVYTMTEFADGLYVGGEFTAAGGLPAFGIARWDGAVWSAVGAGVNARVYTATAHDGALYIGGAFSRSGAVDVPHIARWDGASWLPVGVEVGGIVYALASYDGSLYAAGDFVAADGTTVNHVMWWDGATWQPMGNGVNGTAHALSVNGTSLFVSGRFTEASGTPAANIARWDGANWYPLGVGMDFRVLSLGIFNGELVAGGSFTRAGDAGASRLARWNGQEWRPLSDGFNGTVYDFATTGDTLYAGGIFSNAPGTGASRVARWDPANGWKSLGEGISGPIGLDGNEDLAMVHAVAVHEGEVWAAGSFTGASGIPSANLAHWNGHSWLAGATSVDGRVWDLVSFGGALYACGEFTSIDGMPISRIARWHGASWQSVGVGTSGASNVMLEHNGDLYVGGGFTAAGGLETYKLARWDGEAWSPVVLTPTFGAVFALASFDGQLIIGGEFDAFNGVSANNIVQWDGSTWTPLLAGLNDPVYALVGHGGSLYAGGNFYASGTNFILYLARWDNTGWQPLGKGMDPEQGWGTVHALADHAGTVFVGGSFAVADTVPSGFVARWKTENPNPVVFRTYGACWCDGQAQVWWEPAHDGLEFRAYRRSQGSADLTRIEARIVKEGHLFRAYDVSALRSETYSYRIVAVSDGLLVSSFDTVLSGERTPFALHQNAPNPFRESTVVRFELEAPTEIDLSLYDVTGAKIATILERWMPAGWHAVSIEAGSLPAGVYFYRLRAGKQAITRKLAVLK